MNNLSLIKLTALLSLATSPLHPQLILGDDYNVVGSGTGFALGSGVNSGIAPPTTRLSGSSAPNMRYMVTDATKAVASYSINASKLAVASAANSGRFSLSSDGVTAFDFGSVLGTAGATPANPIVYEATISMANNSAGIQRFSFALGTVENNANFWDFGVQLYRAASADNFYTIQRRIDRVSSTTSTDSTGTTGDINLAITTTAPATFGSELNFLIRVTDAGAESTTFNSRLQLSMDGGTSWFYDTQTDASLPNGWRLDTNARYFMWDAAASAAATYDNFSLNLITPAVPEPSLLGLGLISGLVARTLRRK
jgi:hypothetical protein